MSPRVDDVRRYLRQTQELFGDELYLNLQPQSPLLDGSFDTDLAVFEQEICTCQKCPLGQTRNKFVFGVGDPNASLLLVGEAPGAEEDRLGEPFVGRAGKLLDKILAAIDRNRHKDVYICNVMKCRPPNNRDPLRAEVDQCEPYLLHQIHLIKPKLIVALGRVAGQTLLNVDKSLKSLRNIFHDYHGTPLMVTYHPAALLRNQDLKRPTWEDFKTIKDFLEQSN
jgi:uracil-DNA glycosylase family 4